MTSTEPPADWEPTEHTVKTETETTYEPPDTEDEETTPPEDEAAGPDEPAPA